MYSTRLFSATLVCPLSGCPSAPAEPLAVIRNRGGKAVDHEKAYELHVNAAARGMPRAQYNTAVQLFEGKGVEQVSGLSSWSFFLSRSDEGLDDVSCGPWMCCTREVISVAGFILRSTV